MSSMRRYRSRGLLRCKTGQFPSSGSSLSSLFLALVRQEKFQIDQDLNLDCVGQRLEIAN